MLVFMSVNETCVYIWDLRNLPETKIKQYQTVNHSEILAYPSDKQDEILSSMFRIKKRNMNVTKESINEQF